MNFADSHFQLTLKTRFYGCWLDVSYGRMLDNWHAEIYGHAGPSPTEELLFTTMSLQPITDQVELIYVVKVVGFHYGVDWGDRCYRQMAKALDAPPTPPVGAQQFIPRPAILAAVATASWARLGSQFGREAPIFVQERKV